MASAIEDEDRNHIFKLELLCPELPNSRFLKISMNMGRLYLRMSEMPNEKIAEGFLSTFNSPKVAFAVGMLEKKFGQGFLSRRLQSIFNPVLIGISTERTGYEAIIAAEGEIAKENRENSLKLVSPLLSKFIIDDETEPLSQGEQKDKEPNFIMRAINGLLGKDK